MKEIISKIESKEITIKELAKKYDRSDRTIQNKISDLGYKWDAKNVKYIFTGEGNEPLDVEFDSLFTRKSTRKSKNKIASEKEYNNPSENASNKDSDLIDKILFGEEEPERVYKGYYFDKDVLNVLETKVPRGKKSTFLNEVLRKIFKEKGLM